MQQKYYKSSAKLQLRSPMCLKENNLVESVSIIITYTKSVMELAKQVYSSNKPLKF